MKLEVAYNNWVLPYPFIISLLFPLSTLGHFCSTVIQALQVYIYIYIYSHISTTHTPIKIFYYNFDCYRFLGKFRNTFLRDGMTSNSFWKAMTKFNFMNESTGMKLVKLDIKKQSYSLFYYYVPSSWVIPFGFSVPSIWIQKLFLSINLWAKIYFDLVAFDGLSMFFFLENVRTLMWYQVL